MGGVHFADMLIALYDTRIKDQEMVPKSSISLCLHMWLLCHHHCNQAGVSKKSY